LRKKMRAQEMVAFFKALAPTVIGIGSLRRIAPLGAAFAVVRP